MKKEKLIPVYCTKYIGNGRNIMLHFSRYFFIATSQGTNGITCIESGTPIYGLIFAIP